MSRFELIMFLDSLGHKYERHLSPVVVRFLCRMVDKVMWQTELPTLARREVDTAKPRVRRWHPA